MGTPKNRWRLISQSPLSPPTHDSYRCRMYSGCHASSAPRASSCPRSAGSRPPLVMYHWRVVTISSGLSPFSKNLTGWVIGFGSPSVWPASVSSSAMRSLAACAVLPPSSAYAFWPDSEVIQAGISRVRRPSHPITGRVGSASSRHHVTSVTSPNVQIMAMPDPLSGSASGWASTGTSTSKRGERTVEPNIGW